MRVWIYSRLSNDDDREMNSLLNQQEICRAFAERQRHQIIGLSSDDNVSGMNFSRRGLSSMIWDERHRRKFGRNSAVEKCGLRTKPEMVTTSGPMPVSKMC